MAITDRPIATASLRETINSIESAVREHEESVIKGILGELGDLADGVAAGGNVRAMASQRDRTDRIVRAVRKLSGAGPLADYALGYLDDCDRRLDRARTRALGAAAAARDEHEARGLRERVLVLLAEPRRPRDLADELRCDPSQVSRALRELQAEGRAIVTVAPGSASEDRRAHWYVRQPLGRVAA